MKRLQLTCPNCNTDFAASHVLFGQNGEVSFRGQCTSCKEHLSFDSDLQTILETLYCGVKEKKPKDTNGKH